jgi:hypothetical protein
MHAIRPLAHDRAEIESTVDLNVASD